MPFKLKPAALRHKWLEYCKKCDELNIEKVRYRELIVEVPRRVIYGIDSFCCFAGIYEEDLKVWEKNRHYTELVKEIRYTVLARKLEALVNREGSTSGLIFDLKANYGLYAKKAGDNGDEDYNITFNLDTPTLDNEEIRAYNREKYMPGKKEDVHTAVEPAAAPPASNLNDAPEKIVYASYTHIY